MVGCGKMAEALADGLQTTFPSAEVHAFDLNESRSDLFRSRFGAVVHSSASEAVRGADLLLLACKPQNIEAVGKELAGSIDESTVVLSILAGTPLAVARYAYSSPAALPLAGLSAAALALAAAVDEATGAVAGVSDGASACSSDTRGEIALFSQAMALRRGR